MTDHDDFAGIDDDADLEAHPLTAARLAKYRAVMADGGFPYSFDRSHTSGDIRAGYGDLAPGSGTSTEVSVAGRLMNVRDMGKLAFGVLSDVDGTIQLFADLRGLGEERFAEFLELDHGDWVGASGEVITTKRGELSVRVSSFVLLQKSLRPIPDKWHGLQDVEQRSRRRYIDLMANDDSRRIARTRSLIVSELRRQFDGRGYIEVETPVLLNQATGATARPFATHHNALDLDMSLRIATELYLKRLVVGGLERVYEIGRIFRNEGIDATHNPEFTMLESYEAFADFEDMMELVEVVVAACAEVAAGATTIVYRGRELDLAGPYRRVSMLDLVRDATAADIGYDTDRQDLVELAVGHGVDVEPQWGSGRIVEALFDELVEPSIWDPTFVTEHPIETSPLARAHRSKPHVTERFELFIAGSEYVNAFSELNDPIDQRARFEAQRDLRSAGDEEAHPLDEDYLLALEYGLPPTGGIGIGVDRLVMLLTDQHHIREVILFPTMRPV
jgi:lysyl-tRNA synthetase, class II